MGLLRKELIDTLGLETARRLLLRFGFADGYHDAVSLRDRSQLAESDRRAASRRRSAQLEGIVRAEIIKIDHDAASGRFEEEVVWHDSYVAEQHVHHYGKSTRAGLLVSDGLRERIRERVFRTGDLLPGARVLGAGQDMLLGRREGRRELGRRPRAASRSTFRAPDLGHEVERLREAVHKQLQDLDRRERLVAKRERELDVLRERVARHAAVQALHCAAARRCRRCSSSRRAWRRSIRRSWSTARAAPARSSSSG